MKTKWIKPMSALSFLIILSLHPGDALAAASEALLSWALSVVPALLPFLIAAPALTCPEVCNLLARGSKPFLRLLRLPIGSTGALLIGLISGSPAGAAALASIAPAENDPPGSFLRAALIASGASPAFLMSGVASVMLNSPAVGWLLVRSQLLAVLSSGLLLRRCGAGQPIHPPESVHRQSAVSSATQILLTIGGYMVLFAVLARLITLLTHPSLDAPLLALLELAGGCRALAQLPYRTELILPLISAASCFGGLSVLMQCMHYLAPLGVRHLDYAAGKLLQAALAALYTQLQLDQPWKSADPALRSVICLSVLCLILLIFLRSQGSSAKASL